MCGYGVSLEFVRNTSRKVDLYEAFMDLEKAPDRLIRAALWKVL